MLVRKVFSTLVDSKDGGLAFLYLDYKIIFILAVENPSVYFPYL